MSNAPRTLEDTIALAVSQWGVSWPNAWWPGGNPTYNDCAKFMGWILGLSDTYLVSDIQLRRGFEFHAGSSGIRRGDIVGWNWDGGSAGNYDHTGICTRVVGSTVYTVDANSGPGDQVGEYGRHVNYITSYVRPAYPGISTAGEGSTPFPITLKGKEDMTAIVIARNNGNPYKFTDGKVQYLNYEQVGVVEKGEGISRISDVSDGELGWFIEAYVGPGVTTAQVLAMGSGDKSVIVAPWRKATSTGTAPTIDYDKIKALLPTAADIAALVPKAPTKITGTLS